MPDFSPKQLTRFAQIVGLICVVVSTYFIIKHYSLARQDRINYETAIAEADLLLTSLQDYLAIIDRSDVIPIGERNEARLRCWAFFVKTSEISNSFQPAPHVHMSAYWYFRRTVEETCAEVWWWRPESATAITLTSEERQSLAFAIDFFGKIQTDLHTARDDPAWNRNPKQSWIRLLQSWDRTANEIEHLRPWVKQQ